MAKEPKTPTITAKEKAHEFLMRKSKDDAIKEITQLLYLSEDCDFAKMYWTDVLNHVNAQVVKKHVGYIG